jgi:hypothetical protein
MQAQTDALEGLDEAAKFLAAKKGISYAAAYKLFLEAYPRYYDTYLQERADHAPGTSAARKYLQVVDRLTRRN